MSKADDQTYEIAEMSRGFHRRFVDMAHSATVARVILGLALVLTGLAWYFSHITVEQSTEERFTFRAKEIETAIADRMLGYETILWSGAGVFNGSDDVERQEWAEFVDTLGLDERLPGIQGIGWSIPVDPSELEAHEAAIRAEGFPDYAVQPEGERDEYTTIVFLEPFDWRNQRAFGFDMWSNAKRQEAMRRARDTGQAATSAMITLVQETDADTQRGFLTYVPVYEGAVTPATVAGRQANHVGWVYAPFRMNDLMEGVVGSGDDAVHYEIFDGASVDPERLLYDSNRDLSTGADADGLSRQTTVMMQGHPWTLLFEPGPDLARRSDTLPTYVAIAGLIIDALLFFVISSLGLLNRRAETLAAEMTTELRVANEKLRDRSVELERRALELRRSNDELRQFAKVASHDLQEPLRTMGSYSSLVASTYDDQLDDEGRRWLGYITGAAKRLSELIREILQMSTLDELSTAPVDLGEVMDEVLEELSMAIEEASAEVAVAVDPLPTVIGDRVQLKRLLSNLVRNAISYTRAGVAPQVEVGADQTTEGWRIHVGDNGIGIEPEHHERIFEVFRRVATDPATEGTGMGLAICRKIAQSHGGDIGVVSSPGVGSEFWFTLPSLELTGAPDDGAGERLETDAVDRVPSHHQEPRRIEEAV